MKSRLKDLKINSVDLCKVGANQQAFIQLTKSMREEEEMTLQKALMAVAKMFGKEVTEEEVLQIAKEAAEGKDMERAEKIKKAMEESFYSILEDTDLSKEEKESMIQKNIVDFYEDIHKAALEGTVIGQMEQAEEGEKKVAKTEQEVTREKEAEKTEKEDTALKKALDDAAAAKAQVESLKKALDLERLHQVAKRYEVLGEDTEALAKMFYDMQESNENFYHKYIDVLEKQLVLTKHAGLFQEIGSSRGGDISMRKALDGIIKKMMEADPKMTYEQAFVKACDENPELKNALI